MTSFLLVLAIVELIALPFSISMATAFMRLGQENSRAHAILGAGYILAILVVFGWLGAAIAWPLFRLSPNWSAIMSVYHDWQALNAAMLALGAGLMAFTATQLSVLQRRENERRVAQAMLPKALNSLWNYLEQSVKYFGEVYQLAEEAKWAAPLKPKLILPTPTSEHDEVFLANLGLAPDSVRWQIQMVMSELQIFEARTSNFLDTLNTGTPKYVGMHARRHLTDLAITKARVGRLFAYGRLNAEFNSAAFTEKDLKEQLGLDLPTIDDMPELLKTLPGAARKANSSVPYPTLKSAEPE